MPLAVRFQDTERRKYSSASIKMKEKIVFRENSVEVREVIIPAALSEHQRMTSD